MEISSHNTCGPPDRPALEAATLRNDVFHVIEQHHAFDVEFPWRTTPVNLKYLALRRLPSRKRE